MFTALKRFLAAFLDKLWNSLCTFIVSRHIHIAKIFIEIVNQCVWASGAMYIIFIRM